MAKKYISAVAFFAATVCCVAQADKPQNKLSNDFLNFFIGNWSGDGEFANGKKISADVTFKISLDSSWVTYEHTDRAPNKYKALSLWGIDGANGQFVAYSFDNFRGHRTFASDGWRDGKLILTAHEFYPQRGLFFQHFIYERLSDRSFKMTYEISKDGISWKLGDYLTFTKK
ncbi:MAG TPA: hypothetical protein VL728_17490 [Cyclobacteriaceae bacterium]|jgi:hypothetical protein|nr:hypothetical protein [Cyclobacteriaceae bacterium]